VYITTGSDSFNILKIREPLILCTLRKNESKESLFLIISKPSQITTWFCFIVFVGGGEGGGEDFFSFQN
jgi:hypothetical protein